MPVPMAPQVTLAAEQLSRLGSIVRAHSTPQALAFRCQVILRAAAPDRPSNLQVAQELHCNPLGQNIETPYFPDVYGPICDLTSP